LPAVKSWRSGEVHYDGDVVAHDGATYQALRDTARSLDSADWLCIARSGRDGADGMSFTIRDTYDPAATYHKLDVVTLNSTWFAAKKDAPGVCPGPDWKAGPTGRRGDRGERGPRGEKGDPALPAREYTSWKIDRENYRVVPEFSDGSLGVPIDIRSLFERYDQEIEGR
jgi:hypothetical protein